MLFFPSEHPEKPRPRLFGYNRCGAVLAGHIGPAKPNYRE
jgi:hypothetical protein